MKFFDESRAWDIVTSLDREGAICVPDYLADSTRWALLEELRLRTLTPQPKEMGMYRVRQDYRAVSEFVPESRFLAVRDELQSHLGDLAEVGAARGAEVFATRLRFNDLVVQTYESTPQGISPHRDGRSRINLIALLVLEGSGGFYLCDDREGTNPRPVRSEPGDCILMRGPGFLGGMVQPFHYVGAVTGRRTTFGLRQREES